MNVDDYLIMTDDEIDFDALDLDLLATLASQERDPFIATSALSVLFKRDGRRAAEVSTSILQGTHSDEHLRAFSMTTLFALDPDLGVAEMRRLLQGDLDARILGAMVENVMSDISRFVADPIVTLVKAKVKKLPLNSFSDVDEVARFMSLEASGS